MNFKKLLKVINACVYISVWSLFFLNFLHAQGSAAVTFNGVPVVSGKMNEHNQIIIVVTMDDASYNGGEVQAFVAYAESGTPNIGASTTILPAVEGDDVGIQNGTATLTFNAAHIQDINGSTYKHEDTFDIKLKLDKMDGSGDFEIPINDWGAAGGNNHLMFE